MPAITPYMLTFHSGLHVGTRGVNLEEQSVTLPSDTLFAAIMDSWGRLGGNLEQFTSLFVAHPAHPPFLVSSAFPISGEVRFYPIPVDLERLFHGETRKARRKDLKRLRFFSEKLLRLALGGQKLDDWLFPSDDSQTPEKGVALQGGRLWLTLDEVEALPEEFTKRERAGRGKETRPPYALRYLNVWSAKSVPRVTIDRITSASTIYQAGRVTFGPGCGLWFGVEWRTPEADLPPEGTSYRTAFNRALKALQDDGLGGERTAGYGGFIYREREPFTLPDASPGQAAMLINRYHPRADELPAALSDSAAYNLVAVSGWLGSIEGPAQRRKRIYFVSEGSLVAAPTYPAGDLTDVRPTYKNPEGDLPHPVYRAGMALAIGWPMAKEAGNG